MQEEQISPGITGLPLRRPEPVGTPTWPHATAIGLMKTFASADETWVSNTTGTERERLLKVPSSFLWAKRLTKSMEVHGNEVGHSKGLFCGVTPALPAHRHRSHTHAGVLKHTSVAWEGKSQISRKAVLPLKNHSCH